MDVETVVRAQGGDQGAFTRLAEELAPRFHGVAYGILRDRLMAEDACQQALVTVWRDLPRLREAGRFAAWAMRILVNACYSEGRRARSRRWLPAMLPETSEPLAPDGYGGVIDRDQLERGLRRLSIEHRAAVVLRYYLDLPAADMARVLGIPVGTVASRLHRAMADLRASLEADARSTPGNAATAASPETSR